MNKNKILITIFIIILTLPALDAIFRFSPIQQLFEKRQLSPKPDFPKSVANLKTFPQKYENYFNDNYGFRKTFIAANSYLMDNVFNESPDARAVRGKDDWLFFDNHGSLLDAAGKAYISDKLIARGIEHFYRNWQEAKAQNIEYVLVIAADKSTIYSEYLPDYINVKNNHRIDKFLKALQKKYPNFPVVDLRATILEAKKHETVYHKTDTHWNELGAHYGYMEIMNFLKKNNPEILIHPRADFVAKNDRFYRGDISDIMGVKTENIDYYLVPKFRKNGFKIDPTDADQKLFHHPIFRGNVDENLPILFVYKDSFFDNLIEYFDESFARSYFINEFPCDINYELIKNYRPNFVIQQFWEDRLEWVLNQCK